MRRSGSSGMRTRMHNGGRVARWGSIRGVRRPLAPLQSPRRYRLAGRGRRQVRVRLVHLVVVLPAEHRTIVTLRNGPSNRVPTSSLCRSRCASRPRRASWAAARPESPTAAWASARSVRRCTAPAPLAGSGCAAPCSPRGWSATWSEYPQNSP